MQTNFFQQIKNLSLPGTWTICIEPASPMVLSVLYKQPCGDPAAKAIPPFALKGSPQEIDEQFFSKIAQPLQQASGLMTSIDQYIKELDAIRVRSKMEKEQEEKQKASKTESAKKYDAIMKIVDEKKAAGKCREAYGKLPKPEDFPDQAEDIRKCRKELISKFEPDLFTA